MNVIEALFLILKYIFIKCIILPRVDHMKATKATANLYQTESTFFKEELKIVDNAIGNTQYPRMQILCRVDLEFVYK